MLEGSTALLRMWHLIINLSGYFHLNGLQTGVKIEIGGFPHLVKPVSIQNGGKLARRSEFSADFHLDAI